MSPSDTPDIDLDACREALRAEQARSLSETDNWSHVDKLQVHRDWDALYRELAPCIDALSPASDEVQALVAQHHAIVARFYTPTWQAYIGMGLFYQENPAMREFHTSYHPRMVEFLAEAMRVYASRHP